MNLTLKKTLLFLFSFYSCPQTIADQTTYSQSYFRRFESAIVKEPVHGDVAFLVGQGAKILGHNVAIRPKKHFINRHNEFPYSLEYGLWKLRDAKIDFEKKLLSLTSDQKFISHKAVALTHSVSGIDDLYIAQIKAVINIIKTSIECQSKGFLSDLIGEPNYEYVATHQLFALILARHNGCLTEKQYEAVLPIYLTRVKKEFDFSDDKLSDLQIERAAMLAFAGRIDLVPNTFINHVIASQRSDGFWLYTDNITPRFIPKEHTSALAYYLLAIFHQKYQSEIKHFGSP